jgi:hypothetical protein
MDDLRVYFDSVKGFGVLSTADAQGRVNAAVFGRPRFLQDGSLAFIMPDKKTHANLGENPCAHYLFREDGPGYKGVRLALEKTGEETDTELLRSLRRRESRAGEEGRRWLVRFRVAGRLPLVGAEEK